MLLSFSTYSQKEINREWAEQINAVFEHLEKNRVPHGILLDYAMEFTDVTAYDGRLTDSTYVNATVFSNIYKTLFMGRVTPDTIAFPRIENIGKKWFTYRNNYNQNEDIPVLVLSGLYYEYAQFDSLALGQNRIRVENNKYYDSYINGVWQNPYEISQAIAYALPVKQLRNRKFEVILPEDMLFSNSRGKISKIEIDFADGRGYTELQIGQRLVVEYPENGIYRWNIRTTLINDLQLFSGIAVSLNQYDNPNQQNVFIAGPGSSQFSAKKGAILRIDYAPAHNGQIRKPFIVAEGFDPGSILTPEEPGGDRTLSNFFSDVFQYAGDSLYGLLYGSNRQYDIIYIDWQNGTANIKHNSEVLRNVINWVNEKKAQAGSTESNVLLGQSMGGLVSRYTLAKMEQDEEEEPHDVRLFIAHDSPMRGANTPIGLQHFTRHMYDQYTSSPASYGLGEVVMPMFYDLANLVSEAINLFGGNTSVGNYISPETALTIQDTPAAVQMNYYYVDMYGSPTAMFHTAWQQEFDEAGYPQNSENIAISNGNECAVDHGFDPGDKILSLHETHNYSFWHDWLAGLATGVGGSFVIDPALTILGPIPGKSTYTIDFDIHTNPGQYSMSRRVYYGRIRYHKRILWIGPTLTYNILESVKDAPPGYLPFDSYSGGFYDITNVTDDLPVGMASQAFVNPKYSFIPVASALDIRRNNQEPHHEDYLRKYHGGSVSYTNLTSGFDNFIVDFNKNNPINNPHISFQARNGNWLAEELNGGQPMADCSYACDTGIMGPNDLCSTAVFSVPNGAPIYSWSITSGSGLAHITGGNGTNQITVTKTGNGQGSITLKVEYGDGNTVCGNLTLTKVVSVGLPLFVSVDPVGDQSGYDPSEPDISMGTGACNQISLQAVFSSHSPILEYQWEKITTDVSWAVYQTTGYFSLSPQCNKDFTFKVRARNACGWTAWEEITYAMNRCTENCGQSGPGTIVGTNFVLSPNPVSQGLIEAKVKSGAPWFTTTPPDPDPTGPGTGTGSGGEQLPVTDFNPIVNITIYNLSGIAVLAFPNTQLPTTLNISSLSTGSYLLQLEYQGLTESHIIVKQ